MTRAYGRRRPKLRTYCFYNVDDSGKEMIVGKIGAYNIIDAACKARRKGIRWVALEIEE